MNTLDKNMAELNQLCNENDEIYHLLAQHWGISDSIYWILYILYDSNGPVSQADLCSDWFYSKQTVNSSISSMVKRGLVVLEGIPGAGHRKNIILTKTGRAFCTKVIGETRDMERAVLARFSPEEQAQLLSLFRRSNQYLREEYEQFRKGTAK